MAAATRQECCRAAPRPVQALEAPQAAEETTALSGKPVPRCGFLSTKWPCAKGHRFLCGFTGAFKEIAMAHAFKRVSLQVVTQLKADGCHFSGEQWDRRLWAKDASDSVCHAVTVSEELGGVGWGVGVGSGRWGGCGRVGGGGVGRAGVGGGGRLLSFPSGSGNLTCLSAAESESARGRPLPGQ